jgi:hypothetical protein
VSVSADTPIGMTQDYGRIAALWQEKHKPMYELKESDVGVIGSIELLHKCMNQIDTLSNEFIERLSSWWL